MNQESTIHSVVQIFSEGAFGQSVAEYLRLFCSRVHHRQLNVANFNLSRDLLDISFPIVLAVSRPLPNICEQLDQEVFSTGISFLPVIFRGNLLEIGPFVGPDSKSCWGCWQKRSLQHSAWPHEDGVMLEFYSREHSAGPIGFLQSFCFMGAARVAQVLSRTKQKSLAGEIWQLKLYTREITIGASLGVHNCPRCGLRRPAISRTVDLLRQKMSDVMVS